MSYVVLAIACSENIYARPCISSYVRLGHDNNTQIAIYVMHRRRKVRLSLVFGVKKQKRSMAYKTENVALESPFSQGRHLNGD